MWKNRERHKHGGMDGWIEKDRQSVRQIVKGKGDQPLKETRAKIRWIEKKKDK